MKQYWIILIFAGLAFTGCETVPKEPDKTIPQLNAIGGNYSYSSSFVGLLDDFSKEINRYQDRDGNNLIGYIEVTRISKSEHKILFYGLTQSELEDHVSNIDDIFQYQKIHWGVNFGFDGLVISKIGGKRLLIKESGIKNYEEANTKLPSWLALIRNDSLVKLNKFAAPPFRNFGVSKFDGTRIKSFKVSEWGDIISEKGDTVGKYNGTDNW